MSGMTIDSINIGLPKEETFHGEVVRTGICKHPTDRPVDLRKIGFVGDGVANLRYHGGEDKAVCVYGTNHYHYWEEVMGIQLPPAPFGENLSVSDFHEDGVCIGDVYQIGTALVQVSQPRQPCATLAKRYGRRDMLKLVADSGRTGCYFRVAEEGTVKRGDHLILMERDSHNIPVSFANHIYYHDRQNRDGIEKVLAIPALSASWQRSFQILRDRCSKD
jgi:MOSC domain-containing protein YiiM